MKAGLSLIMNTKIKACIFDIDDTLFDMKKKTFIQSALKALKQLEENGIKIILATGRPPQTAKAIREYDIQPDYTVCTNGHIILDKDGSILMQNAQTDYDYYRQLLDITEENAFVILLGHATVDDLVFIDVRVSALLQQILHGGHVL